MSGVLINAGGASSSVRSHLGGSHLGGSARSRSGSNLSRSSQARLTMATAAVLPSVSPSKGGVRSSIVAGQEHR